MTKHDDCFDCLAILSQPYPALWLACDHCFGCRVSSRAASASAQQAYWAAEASKISNGEQLKSTCCKFGIACMLLWHQAQHDFEYVQTRLSTVLKKQVAAHNYETH